MQASDTGAAFAANHARDSEFDARRMRPDPGREQTLYRQPEYGALDLKLMRQQQRPLFTERTGSNSPFHYENKAQRSYHTRSAAASSASTVGSKRGERRCDTGSPTLTQQRHRGHEPYLTAANKRGRARPRLQRNGSKVAHDASVQIGRASCRERVCSVV